jgi:FixJ family two-component response regulator
MGLVKRVAEGSWVERAPRAGFFRNGRKCVPRERCVYVVDDASALHISLGQLLRSAGFTVTAFHTAESFLDAVPRLAAGCVLLDLDLPDVDGLEVQAGLRARDADLPVVMMTAHGDVATAVRAMKAGAVDFLGKPISNNDLVNAVETALRPRGSAAPDREEADAAHRIMLLTTREREVLEALTSGHPNKRIANDLGLSVRTIEVHRARMMRRLGVRQFAEAVRIAVLATKAAERTRR